MKLCLINNIGAHYRSLIFQLLDQEYDCDFIFGENESDVKTMNFELLHGNVSVFQVKKWKHFYFQYGLLSSLYKKYDCYLVLGEIRNLSLWIMLLLNIFSRKKIFLWTHGWYGKESLIKRLIGRCFYGLSTGAFIYNNYSRNLMIQGGIPSHKLYTIYNSLNYREQLKIRDILVCEDIYKRHFNNTNKVIICIGRLNLRKRLDILFDVIQYLNSKNRFYNVVLIGDGNDRTHLELLAHEKNIDKNVWFYGPCYDELTNAKLLYNADLCVVPGDIGLTAIHSLTFGTPIITHDDFPHQGPEFESIKEGITGMYYRHNDVHDLADKIVYWFDNYATDRNLVRKNCYMEIDTKWNPYNQIKIFKEILY